MSNHYLIEKYPSGFETVTAFGKAHPEILPERRARNMIATLTQQPEPVQRVFRKRFGRWGIHVPSLVNYLELDAPLISTRNVGR
ncbi:hypothetical protein R0135_03365 [Congregibacter variabilis]|uniref:Uncharacterized protein n=1 Tax=Congregibacter variabilis TaxID=3081200 RepID=A0ABZ0I5V5_9GAMM|nr:hypothetical protein R0135_03365 [Congregibacter sp. IMCC43200]